MIIPLCLSLRLLNMGNHRQEHIQLNLIILLNIGIMPTLNHKQSIDILKDIKSINKISMWQHDLGQLINDYLNLLTLFGKAEVVKLDT